MKNRSAHEGRSERRSGGRPFESSERFGRCATWAQVDAELEVRARIVVAIDELAIGDVLTCDLVLAQLLDDLDRAEHLPANEVA